MNIYRTIEDDPQEGKWEKATTMKTSTRIYKEETGEGLIDGRFQKINLSDYIKYLKRNGFKLDKKLENLIS